MGCDEGGGRCTRRVESRMSRTVLEFQEASVRIRARDGGGLPHTGHADLCVARVDALRPVDYPSFSYWR